MLLHPARTTYTSYQHPSCRCCCYCLLQCCQPHTPVAAAYVTKIPVNSAAMSLPGPQGPGYDYVTALTNLRDKIAELSAVQQQQRGHSSQLSSGLQFWRRNKSNVFFVFTMYAMSTASVISAVMAESRLQVGCCCCRVVQVLQIKRRFYTR